MSALSSVALVPSVANVAMAPAQAGDSQSLDAKLLDLGSRLDVAVAEESALYEKSEHLHETLRLEPLRQTLQYRSGSKSDSEIVQLLGEFEWEAGMSFNPADVEDLRRLVHTGKKKIDARIAELIATSDELVRRLSQPHIEEAGRQCEEANARTTAIVRSIEAQPAHTMAGLLVKATAVRWCRTGELDDDELARAATDTRILHSILLDIFAINEQSASQTERT